MEGGEKNDWQTASLMGQGHISDAICKLTDFLLINKINKPYVIGWGIANQIQFISQNKITPIQIRFLDNPKQEEIIGRYKGILKRPDSKYIFYDEDLATEELYYELFHKAAEGLSLNPRNEKIIFAPDGLMPVYLIYSIDN